jgi:hypothetical protein
MTRNDATGRKDFTWRRIEDEGFFPSRLLEVLRLVLDRGDLVVVEDPASTGRAGGFSTSLIGYVRMRTSSGGNARLLARA